MSTTLYLHFSFYYKYNGAQHLWLAYPSPILQIGRCAAPLVDLSISRFYKYDGALHLWWVDT
jgi:hypothetical protein